MPLLDQYANGVITAIGFFWNALWAFVLGYAISAAIQVFVPKKRTVAFSKRRTFYCHRRIHVCINQSGD